MSASARPTDLPSRLAALPWQQLWLDVGLPLVITRLALLLVGWLARYIAVSPDYPLEIVRERGWQYTPHRLIDVWARWDSGWYMSVIREGYTLRGDLNQVQSNVSFFPLYPFAVRALTWPVPPDLRRDVVIVLAGALLSTLMLLAASLLLYRLALELTDRREVAQRTIRYLLLFPTAFIFSALYTEATFLFFAVAAFFAAHRRAWGWAAVAAALLALTRHVGILALPALIWLYFDSIDWQPRRVGRGLLWLLLVPTGLLLHLTWLYQLTGDFLAPIRVQQSYDRTLSWPWQTWLNPINPNMAMTPLERFFVLLFLFCAVVALVRLPSPGYGLYALALIGVPLFTGTLYGTLRFIMVAFPVYIILAQAGRRPWVDQSLQFGMFALQIFLMVAWSQFYWVT